MSGRSIAPYCPWWRVKVTCQNVSRKLERYQHGIIAHCQHRMHTSLLEGVNNKIKVIKRTAYGFHDLDHFARNVKQASPGRESTD